MKKPIFFSLTLFTLPLFSAAKQNTCAPDSPANCYPDDCTKTYCLGPSNFASNPSARPYTCNGDVELEVSGLYWVAYQDGMEYAIETENFSQLPEVSILVNAGYKSPKFDWNFGYKMGLRYNGFCDGWDFGIRWTNYGGSATSHNEAELDDNARLLTLWTGFLTGVVGDPISVTDIQTDWKLDLNLIDLDLGRMYWNSRRVNLRPHIGIRIAYLDQKYTIKQNGGVFFTDENDQIELKNDSKGAGVRAGLDSLWHLGCGWSIYGDFALSVLAMKFHIDHDESLRQVQSPFEKRKILETKNIVHKNTLAIDLGIGIQYQTLLCDCDYALAVSLGYEQHLFTGQNQMWRLNGEGLNTQYIYNQRRGDLSTQGWTLKATFDF